MNKENILDLTFDELQGWLIKNNVQKFRAKQIFELIYKQKKDEFNKFHNIPKALINQLEENFDFRTISIKEHLISKNKQTEKLLLSLKDNNVIESVLMDHKNRFSGCISSQVGCGMNCGFCATANLGYKRNLTSSEIIEQILILLEKKEVHNFVFMGMGEPLLNYDNVVKAVKLINEPEGLCISPRRITISTSGVAKFIKELAKDLPRVKLSVSLNTLNPELREELMPVTKANPIDKLISALEYYQEKTRNRFTFEYILFKDLNMKRKDAESIIELHEHLDFYLNVIPYNPLPFYKYTSPDEEEVDKFIGYFRNKNITVVKRSTKGRDIFAACGQLALLKR